MGAAAVSDRDREIGREGNKEGKNNKGGKNENSKVELEMVENGRLI